MIFRKFFGFVVIVVIFFVVILIGCLLWVYYMDDLWICDGCVCVEIVNVVLDVLGVIVELFVYDN